MPYHQGRLIDHIGIHVSVLSRSRTFYLAILSALGKSDGFGSYGKGFYFDELYFGSEGPPSSNLHLAFQADSIEAVHAFHSAGISAGGTDNGQPGYREYHETYYAAFLLDPDGNNIEAVCDVGSVRSSASVVVTSSGDAA
jgi:catechol 2,3-dioxygenase-like lactoylglutathione lyase family enzyme